jgi:tRNA A-37 threonylcarbamoyl transferase component Bud32
MAPLPSTIGRYRPVALLGSGAMGSVYRAHDPLIDRMVAVKVVRTDAVDPEVRTEFFERFRQEVQAAGRCSHPGIVGVYDYIADAGDPSIVMELVEGSSLQQILRDPAARASLQAVPVLLQVLEGLGYAHGQGVIHRDIKPANIIVTPSGQAKIADFGIARLNEAALTQAGAMLGTPHYMAPEQVADEDVDRRADLFAVGAIFYEILAGRPPFAGRTLAETIQRLTGPLEVDLGPIAAEPAYVSVLRKALAKDRSQRFRSADAFGAALQSATDASQPTIVAPLRDPAMRTAPARALPARVWDPALLQRVERHLATHVGPMARKAVALAAEASSSAEELYTILARGLPNAADRSTFLRAMGGARVEPSMTAARRIEQTTTAGRHNEPRTDSARRIEPTTTAARRVEPTTAAPGRPNLQAATAGPAMNVSPNLGIPPEAVSAAQSALTFFVGPIARVLVRDAAAKALSAADFIDRLCAHVPKPDEAAALRRRLRADVELR